MKTGVRLGLLCLTVFISCSVIEAHGNRKGQGEALGRLYEVKRRKSSGIDTSPFKASGHADAAAKVGPQEGLKERDRIERLPGQPPVRFAQYGGYVTIDASAGRAFYYYFIEAQHPYPNSLPLLLWLNGGPGCSSFGYGAMQELGPFRVNSDGKTLFKNNYAWNHAANVLFLESPAGVGFSYSNTTSDIEKSGDKSTAIDNYLFLLNWLERFPEYKNRDFYIAGESYGGHYVPQLAQTILHNNINANKTVINLKGIIIGNAAISYETDEMGMYAYYASHAITSYETFNAIQKYCSFSQTNDSQSISDTSTNCVAALAESNNCIGRINIYNIYAPLCFSPNLTANPKMTSVHDFDPCSNEYVHAYLNRPDVQEALHANVTKLSYGWESCSDLVFSWQDSADTIPLIQELMANGLRVWIFSGDTDGRVPVTSTQYSIEQMKLPVKTSWHPWYLRGEVGGYTQVYKGDLTFATVREAGHEVPSYQPERALSLISHFLAGSPLPFH